MARVRNRTRGQILPPDPRRPGAAQHRADELAPTDQSDQRGLAERRRRGIMMWPFRCRPSRDDRLNAELRYHVRQFDDYVREGLSPAEARRRVGIQFGSVELAKDE